MNKVLSKNQFEKNHAIKLSDIQDRAALYNISLQEALWQLIDDAYRNYLDSSQQEVRS